MTFQLKMSKFCKSFYLIPISVVNSTTKSILWKMTNEWMETKIALTKWDLKASMPNHYYTLNTQLLITAYCKARYASVHSIRICFNWIQSINGILKISKMSINHFGFETLLINRKVLRFVRSFPSYKRVIFLFVFVDYICVFRELIHACHLSLGFQILFFHLVPVLVDFSFLHIIFFFSFFFFFELIIIKCLAHNTKRQLSNIFIQTFCHSNYVCVIRLLPWLSHSHQSFRKWNRKEKKKTKWNILFR